jgi:MerR family transcriptional regulator/heat shock protein HspR
MEIGNFGNITVSVSSNTAFKDRDQPIYTISIAARLVRPIRSDDGDMRPLHAQTLRTYEREGLVKPKRVGRNRLYSDRDIERLQQIQYLTQERGVNLAGVEIILDLLERVRELESQSGAKAK